MGLVDRIPPVEKEVPLEPGNYFTFRALSGNEIDTIRKDGATAFADLVKLGLVSWRGPNYQDRPCDEAVKALLDDDTRQWAATEVWECSHLQRGEARSSEHGSTPGAAATSAGRTDSSEQSAAVS